VKHLFKATFAEYTNSLKCITLNLEFKTVYNIKSKIYAAFTHAGLTTRYRKKNLYNIYFCVVKVTRYIVCEEDRKLA